ELAFVDVPGHERFIANMLTGLGPAPGVLFVVAADGGWARQSTEHLAAIDALGLRHGLLAVTRSDLADPGRAIEESLAHIGRSSLGTVPAVAVSGASGAGLDDLRAALATLVAALPAPDPTARVRLWIDRAFSIHGSGTVVTGTLTAGSIAAGDTLLIGAREVTVRGLQSLGRDRDRVAAVARVALNLRGVAPGEVARGHALLSTGTWHTTRVLDVRILGEQPMPSRLALHIGTAGIPCHVRPLGHGTARLTLPRALPMLAGDRGVLRDPGRHAVVAGVEVLDADPPPLRRRGAAAERGAALADGRPDPYDEVVRRGAVRRDHLAAVGIEVPSRDDIHDIDGWLVSDAVWRRWLARAPDAVLRWAARHPLDPSMPLAALSRSLGLPDPAVLPAVLDAAGLATGAGRVEAGVAVTLGPAEQSVRVVEARLREHPFHAPEHHELAELRLGRRELAAAERAGRLLRVGEGIVLLPAAASLAVERLGHLPQPFTTSEARAVLDTTRRVAVPLLEHLDRTGRTERVDARLRRVAQSPPPPPPAPPPAPANGRIAASAAPIEE
ncbi:MAG: SelB C-terminal domain-containing protein, partial [Jatrophihabitantaceae bacterium]